ncbi:phosphoethanolamine N-methyltransferase [Coprinopsis cinerea AmutBmut pab1-1]|nr:phosphoethanolamine N-methyltransferase [Coprinopsis cinerea AmutBmut pab1-1]
MAGLRFATLLWIFLVHLAGIYLFTRGFLLMRLSLTDISDCEPHCTIIPTHKRAIVLVIDALRFDFISPNPPSPPSEYHHNILTLPRRLTEAHPEHSFLFDSHADPPTTTLQRIKGLTTGSLPTFMDIGNNLGGSSIAEDSIMVQLQRAGKKVAFMGDDTWMSVFPNSFHPDMTFPYDSFNVEDLHTVDEGVIEHIFPLLEDPSKPFDFLIGHFLGVDHVGHRAGPEHPIMKSKLQQMNDVLERVVEKMDDDTLLVLLGDHGMDRSGDHGGDSTLETSAALWIYSKGAPLTQKRSKVPIPSGLLQYRTFPGATVPHRAVQQIDLLPTLSLLLGLPIPFNNLGGVIPELFWRDSRGKILERALELNAQQIHRFLTTYRASPSGGELDEAWNTLQRAWEAVANATPGTEAKLVAMNNFARQSLAACRVMWAQFNPILMGMGLALFGMSLCASWGLFVGFSKAQMQWKEWVRGNGSKCLIATIFGTIAGIGVSFVGRMVWEGIGVIDYAIFGATLASCATVIILSPPFTGLSSLSLSPVLMILHAAAFLSNSFTVWENWIIPFFAVTAIIPYTLKGLTSLNAQVRFRTAAFSLLYAIAIRLMSVSTVCREEQQPYCHVTFYASSSLTAPPKLVVLLAIPTALAIPRIIRRFLNPSLSFNGIAKIYYPLIFSPSILGGALYWILEWADTTSALGEEWNPTLRLARTWIARFAFGWVTVAGLALWYYVPLCIEVTAIDKGTVILGFGNIFGASYLVYWSIFFTIVYITTQAPGQIVLGLGMVALIAYLEVVDIERDTTSRSGVRFWDVVAVALLGLHAFYTTGHQSTIPSIQWKTAFLITPTVKYPWSAMTVITNSIGPIFLFALAVPLVVLWGFSPRGIQIPDISSTVELNAALVGIGVMIYYATLLMGASISAAVLRRHLMVWKIFAPRFMAAVLGLVVVDLAVLVGVGFGVWRVGGFVEHTFRKLAGPENEAPKEE